MTSVLVVDDEPDILAISKIFLEEIAGFSITTAKSAEIAIELLNNKKFDVIVSDYQMPEMDGIDFLKYVRKRSDIPFILFTGRGREEVVIEAMNAGASYYIQKGGDPKSQFTFLARQIERAAKVPVNAGIIPLGSNQFIAAMDCFEKARENNLNFKKTVNENLINLIKTGKITEAIQFCDQAIYENPRLSEFWLIKAFLIGLGDNRSNEPSHEVFISHSIEDKEIANRLCHNFEENGIKCWIAPRDIPAGRIWFNEIPHAIQDTKIVVLLLSKSSNKSDNVQREIVAACNFERKILPVRIEKIEPSAGIKFLIQIWQIIDIYNDDKNEKVSALIKQLKTELHK